MDFNYDADLALALQLQDEINEEKDSYSDKIRNNLFGKPIGVSAAKNVNEGHNVVDDSLELFDPTPDIYALFREFDRIYFNGKLSGCEVKWSPRMTLCAGLCCYEGHGGLCSIRLSAPLLRLRPRKDLVQTLLHEMIHAYLFVTHNNKDHDAHGPEFLKHMNHINKLSGANVTVYHTFHGEVDAYRQHWWQCSGPCRNRKPFFGLVKRAMNRTPGPNDTWWSEHQKTCDGVFVKIKSPETPANGAKRKAKEPGVSSGIVSPNKKPKPVKKTDDRLFGGAGHVLGSLENNAKNNSHHSASIEKFLTRFQNQGAIASSSSALPKCRTVANGTNETIGLPIGTPPRHPATPPGKHKEQKCIEAFFANHQSQTSNASKESESREDTTEQPVVPRRGPLSAKELYDWIFSDSSDDDPTPQQEPPITLSVNGTDVCPLVSCPVCNSKIPENKINEHLDQCLI